MTDAIRQRISRWRGEAAMLRERYGDDVRARVWELAADELEADANAERSHWDVLLEVLPFAEAATRAGYSRQHFWRLKRDGLLPTVDMGRGREGVQVRDLPIRAGWLASALGLEDAPVAVEDVAGSETEPAASPAFTEVELERYRQQRRRA